MTRDRLHELRRAVEAEKAANGDIVIYIGSEYNNDGFDTTSEEGLAEVLDKIEIIWALIHQLRDDIADLKQLYVDILNTAWTSEKVTAALEEKNRDIQLTITIARSKLDELAKMLPQEQTEGYEPVAVRTLRIHSNSLQRTIRDVIVEYNTALMKHQERCAELVRQQMRIVRRSVSNEELVQGIQNGNKNPFTDNILMETLVAKQALTDLQTRQRELQEIENSLQELMSMFVNMAVLIDKQGDAIDNIEKQVTNTHDYVEKAQVTVKNAKMLRKKYRKKKWCLICFGVVVAVVIVIVIVVLVVTNLPGSSSTPVDTTTQSVNAS